MGYLGNVRPTIALVADDITDGAITAAKIGADAVTSAKIADNAVTSANIADADLTLTSGDFIFATAGKGICLGVTSNTDANTLDDYEEGSWTGTLGGTTSNPSSTITATGYYEKIGTFVHVAINFSTCNTSGAAGMALIHGLPFTLGSPGGFPTGNCMFYGGRFAWSGTPVPYINGSYISLYATASGANWGSVTHNNAGANAQLFVGGQYRSS